MELVLEERDQADGTTVLRSAAGHRLMMAPTDIGGDYWRYRVRLSDSQAIIGFPKFGGIGCGFAVEEDWNTNLPIPFADPQEVFDHIIHNKGDESISDADVLEAIKMVHAAARLHKAMETLSVLRTTIDDPGAGYEMPLPHYLLDAIDLALDYMRVDDGE